MTWGLSAVACMMVICLLTEANGVRITVYTDLGDQYI